MAPEAPLERIDAGLDVVLKSISQADIELLRVHKNAHKERFFHQSDISPQQQASWYRDYRARANDHMYVIHVNASPVGCIGYRVSQECIEFYNLILWDREQRGRGVMHRALRALCEHAQTRTPGSPVVVRVLNSNPALDWYERQGFVKVAEGTGPNSLPYSTLEYRQIDRTEVADD